MVSLVLDTNVVVAALRSDRGASRQWLQAVLDRRVEMLVSVPLLLEYEAVLSRADHLSMAGLSVQEVNVVLDGLALVATPVRLRFLWRPQLKDPADEMVLETAVNGRADMLITLNLRHLGAAAQAFGIRALSPGQAWRAIGGDQLGGRNENQ